MSCYILDLIETLKNDFVKKIPLQDLTASNLMESYWKNQKLIPRLQSISQALHPGL